MRITIKNVTIKICKLRGCWVCGVYGGYGTSSLVAVRESKNLLSSLKVFTIKNIKYALSKAKLIQNAYKKN